MRITYDQMLALQQRHSERHDQEHHLQCACVQWFRLQHPELARLLFAVPNGTNKSQSARIKFQREGLLSGVADLLLLYPSSGYHGLCIEMKSKTGRQQGTQKVWQGAVERVGYKYILCRSFDQFREEVSNYLTDKQ